MDIEAAFSETGNREQDRFDIVLLDKKTNCIKIVEAKLYTNSELHPTKNSSPSVVNQIKRYQDTIEEKRSEIIKAYANYISKVNILFGAALPDVTALKEDVGLLYFGFNDLNKKSETFKNLKDVLTELLPGNKIYPLGDTKNASLKLLF